ALVDEVGADGPDLLNTRLSEAAGNLTACRRTVPIGGHGAQVVPLRRCGALPATGEESGVKLVAAGPNPETGVGRFDGRSRGVVPRRLGELLEEVRVTDGGADHNVDRGRRPRDVLG